jgi:hypothetical protein
VFCWANDRDPHQYGLNFGHWTRRVVAELIERKLCIRLGQTAVGTLLARLRAAGFLPKVWVADEDTLNRQHQIAERMAILEQVVQITGRIQ